MLAIPTKTLAGLAVTAALLAIPAAGVACGFHGGLGDGFSAMHPKSMTVAFAISDAVDAKLLDRRIVAPKLVDMLGLHRATQRLERLRAELQSKAPDTAVPVFSLLLIESGLWSRYTADGGALRLVVHTEAPPAGEAVVVTGDAVLAAIVTGRLTVDDALRRGLIAVDGPQALAQALTAALAP